VLLFGVQLLNKPNNLIGDPKVFHIVYKTTNTINNKIYIGKHSTNNLNDGYLGSGKYLNRAINKYGPDSFKREILGKFATEEEAFLLERELVTADFCNRPDTYNLVPGGSGNWYGTVSVKNSKGETAFLLVGDPRIGVTWFHQQVGLTTVKDADGKTYQVPVDDPRIISGELVGVFKGMVSVKDCNGNTCSVSKDDPRYLSGELVHVFKGTISVKDTEGNKFHVPKDDPRYLSGELVGIRKGGRPTTLGRFAINNGTQTRFIPKGELIPEGWKKGPHKKCQHYHGLPTTKGKILINDGVTMKFIWQEEYIPEGWTKGRIKKEK
jgi:hypothetical protein